MSHVAEGELHAWLDGALDQLGEGRAAQVREHLRHCAACQEQLAVEESLRARASEVLALAAPHTGDMLPLEALVERARRVPAPATPARASRVSRLARLGWAASVMIALGAGWTGRELWLRSGAAGPSSRTYSNAADQMDAAARVDEQPAQVAAAPPAALPPVMEPAAAVGTTVGSAAPTSRTSAAPSLRANAGAPSASPAERSSAATQLADAGASGLSAPSSVPAEIADVDMIASNTAPELLGRVVETVALQPAAPAAAPTVDPVAGAAAAAGKTESARTTREENAIRDLDARAPKATRPAPGRQERAASSSVAQPGTGAIGIQRARPESVRSDVPDLFVQGSNGRQQGRTAAAKVTNQADLDEAADMLVPGLEPLNVVWVEVVPGQRGLRVEQRLPSGDTLEIRFVRSGGAAADAAADPLAAALSATLPEGWSQVFQVHRDGWIVGRARLSRPELEALLQGVGTGSR